jgi:hypothetical protein
MQLTFKCFVAFVIPFVILIASIFLGNYFANGFVDCRGLCEQRGNCATTEKLFVIDSFNFLSLLFAVSSIFAPTICYYIYKSADRLRILP